MSLNVAIYKHDMGTETNYHFLLFKVFAILRNIILPKHLIVVAKKILKLATLKLEVSKDL